MNDFYRISLQNNTYNWQKLNNLNGPGPRCRHSVCVFQDKFYLFGGQIADSISTNDLCQYDCDNESWLKLAVNTTYPPSIDNHSTTLYKDEWIIFGGFYGDNLCTHSNQLYKYSFSSNQWVKMETIAGLAPAPRDGSSIACINDIVYIFGGKNGDLRYNDIWQFNLLKCQWGFIPIRSNEIPKTRSGHSLVSFNNQLVLFGGIHDITWELDDLLTFNPKSKEWKIIDSDSSRKVEQEALLSPMPKSQSINHRRQKNRNKTLLRPLSLKRSPKYLSPPRDSLKSQSKDTSFCQSPSRNESLRTQNNINNISINMSTNNVAERKKQEFQRRKRAMLKLFEVKDRDSMNFCEDCVVTEKLKTSIIVTGNPKSDLKIKQGILTEFGKPLVSKFLQPIIAGQNTIFGKKPCARDGHAVALYNNILYVFGGDRHTMSFNDLYQLDLNQI